MAGDNYLPSLAHSNTQTFPFQEISIYMSYYCSHTYFLFHFMDIFFFNNPPLLIFLNLISTFEYNFFPLTKDCTPVDSFSSHSCSRVLYHQTLQLLECLTGSYRYAQANFELACSDNNLSEDLALRALSCLPHPHI